MNKVDANLLVRPEEADRSIADGSYRGKLVALSTKEVESKFTETGKRQVLELELQVNTPTGGVVKLTHQVTLTWNVKGKMLPLLDKLGALPQPGQALDINSLIGIPVQVIVENVKRGDRTFSNIVSIKRAEGTEFEPKPASTLSRDYEADISDLMED